MSERIFTPEKEKKYVHTRLNGSNVGFEDVDGIYIYNGMMNSMLKTYLESDFIKVDQKNEREPVYLKDRNLHLAQWSRHKRRKRYERSAKGYDEVCQRQFGKSIEIKSLELNGIRRKTNQAYSDYAYDFVTGLFVPKKDSEKNYEEHRVFEGYDINDVDTIIFAPTKGVKQQAKVIAESQKEYLDALLVEVGGKKILNLGYVYGDQISLLIDKIMSEYASITPNGKKRKIDIYMVGRGAGLLDHFERGNPLAPKGMINDQEIKGNNVPVKNIDNLMADGSFYEGLNLNVGSVLDETVEQLERARDLGCISVDMELLNLFLSTELASIDYDGILDISTGAIFYDSDNPLKIDPITGERDTLADELESNYGRDITITATFKKIKERG